MAGTSFGQAFHSLHVSRRPDQHRPRHERAGCRISAGWQVRAQRVAPSWPDTPQRCTRRHRCGIDTTPCAAGRAPGRAPGRQVHPPAGRLPGRVIFRCGKRRISGAFIAELSYAVLIHGVFFCGMLNMHKRVTYTRMRRSLRLLMIQHGLQQLFWGRTHAACPSRFDSIYASASDSI